MAQASPETLRRLFGIKPVTDDMRQMCEDIAAVEPLPVIERSRLMLSQFHVASEFADFLGSLRPRNRWSV